MIGIHSSLYGYPFFFFLEGYPWLDAYVFKYVYIYIYIQESCVRVLYILTKLSSSMAYNFASSM
jgi:hypothetical protein